MVKSECKKCGCPCACKGHKTAPRRVRPRGRARANLPLMNVFPQLSQISLTQAPNPLKALTTYSPLGRDAVADVAEDVLLRRRELPLRRIEPGQIRAVAPRPVAILAEAAAAAAQERMRQQERREEERAEGERAVLAARAIGRAQRVAAVGMERARAAQELASERERASQELAEAIGAERGRTINVGGRERTLGELGALTQPGSAERLIIRSYANVGRRAAAAAAGGGEEDEE